MTKTIAVIGATGTQGGSVARAMLDAGWQVRALTRTPNSEAAKALSSKGAEIVQADTDDEASLLKAFNGVQAIFSMTTWAPYMAAGKTSHEACKLEQAQAMSIARAAAKMEGLEHFVRSTSPPSSNKKFDGVHRVAHIDYKAEADELIRAELPELARKTTFLYCGWYPQNIVLRAFMRPFEVPGSGGNHLFMTPAAADSRSFFSGDMAVTPGIWVKAILERPEKTFGKYASIAPEVLTWRALLGIWSQVTGKPAVHVQCSLEESADLWGPLGVELATQLKWGETVEDWNSVGPGPFVTMSELGISGEDIGAKAAFERLRDEGHLSVLSK